jgi:protein-S-isoprenylcysteine O-methyltransferase Ste14
MSMKLKYFIDSNKGITFIVILTMMAIYHRWNNPTAWVYLALHGTYGLLWVLKSKIFPDASWERKTSFWFGLISWFSLVLYWFPGWWIIWKNITAPFWLLAACTSLYIFGVFFVFTSDMQKFTALHLHPGELITDGMFRLSRNINYFGEFLIYTAFATLPMVWFAFLPLTAFIVTFWVPNMLRKDRVLSTFPGFLTYKKKTRSFFPFLF